MLSNAQVIEAKTNWIELLRAKVDKWKADTDIYIQNSESLLRDDVIDIARGIKTEIVLSPKSHKLQELHLDKDGSLPHEYMTKLDAVTAYAVDMGIDIEYGMDFVGDNVIIKWQVNSVNDSSIVENWVSKPMQLTRAKIIEEIVELEKTEDKKGLVSAEFPKIAYNPFTS